MPTRPSTEYFPGRTSNTCVLSARRYSHCQLPGSVPVSDSAALASCHHGPAGSGIGASDSACASHLFYLPRAPHPSLLTGVILSTVPDYPSELRIEIHSFDDG